MLKILGIIMAALSLVVFKIENHGRTVEQRPVRLDLKCDTLFIVGLLMAMFG